VPIEPVLAWEAKEVGKAIRHREAGQPIDQWPSKSAEEGEEREW
jgi:hypothetical protein